MQSGTMTDAAPSSISIEPHLARATAVSQASQTAQSPAGDGAAAQPPPAGANGQTSTEPQPPQPPQQPTGTPAAPATDPNVTAQFAALMRRDNRIREREQQLQQQESELNELRGLRENLRRDPYSVVSQYGGSLEDWSSRLLNQQQAQGAAGQVPREVLSELQDLRAWRQQTEQQQAQQQQQMQQAQQQENLTRLRGEISTFLENTPDYHPLHHAGMAEQVYQVMANHAWQTQQMYGEAQALPIAEAARIAMEQQLPHLQQRVRGLLSTPQFADLRSELVNGTQATAAQAQPQPQQTVASPPPAPTSFQETVKAPAGPPTSGPSSVAAIHGSRRPTVVNTPANRESRLAAALQAYQRHSSGG